MRTFMWKRLSLPFVLALWMVSLPTGVLQAAKITVLSAVGNWRDPIYSGSGGLGAIRNGDPTSSIDWGGTVAISGYDFTKNIPGPQILPPVPTPLFPLGTFTHRNQDLTPNPSFRTLSTVKLDIVLTLDVDGSLVGPLTFTFNFTHDETSNTSNLSQCDPAKLNPASTVPCPDVVTLTASPTPTTFRVSGVDYTLAMSFVDSQGHAVARFITEEYQTNVANLVGQFNTPASGGGTNQAPSANAGPDQTITFPALAHLSGTATDDGLPNNILTVNWTKVSGPGAVLFGNNQSLVTDVSFSSPGTYVLRLTASDTALTASDTITITVDSVVPPPPPSPILTRIEVRPSSATLAMGDAHTFTAVAYDQYGSVMNGALFNWSATGPNTVTPQTNSATSVFTAGNTAGIYQIVASSNSVTGRAIVAVQAGVSSGVIWLVDAATATPNPVAGTLTHLHVLAQSTNPGPITYRWSVPNNNTMTIIDPNAHDTDVTFTQPGVYQFQVRMTDSMGLQLFSEVSVTVEQTATRVMVSPASTVVQVNQPAQFTAQVYDQFQQPMNVPVTWSAAPVGSISAAGEFRSSLPAETVTITARTSNGASGTARVTVQGLDGTTGGAFDLSQAKAYPVPFKSNSGLPGITFAGLGPDTTIRIFSTDGRLVETIRTNGPSVIWPVTNRNQEKVASWVYFYRVENSGGHKEGKLVIIQ